MLFQPEWRIKDESEAQAFWEQIKYHIEEMKPPKPNLSPQERRFIISLKKNRDIVILPVDKGRGTVILDHETYKEKMMELLNSGDYTTCKRNPTARIALTIRRVLTQAEKREISPHTTH